MSKKKEDKKDESNGMKKQNEEPTHKKRFEEIIKVENTKQTMEIKKIL